MFNWFLDASPAMLLLPFRCLSTHGQPGFFLCTCKHLDVQEQDSHTLWLKTKGGGQKDSINSLSPLKLCSMSPLDCTLLEAQEMETSSASPQWRTCWCLYNTVGFHGLVPPEVTQQRILHHWHAGKNLLCTAVVTPTALPRVAGSHLISITSSLQENRSTLKTAE